MTFVKTKGGGLLETGAKEIPLDFTVDNLVKLLTDLINNINIYTHQDFKHLADKYHMFCVEEFEKRNDQGDVEEIVCDIEAQWDLYLFNTYKVDELLKLDLTTIKFPTDWLENWLTQAKNL